MPRKQSPEGKPVDASGTELRAVRVELPPDVHKKFRVEAANRDQSMAALARTLIEEFVGKIKK